MTARVIGIRGQPFVDLEHLIDPAVLRSVDAEITAGLAHAHIGQTGATLKWMGITAPWVPREPHADAMDVIRSLPLDEWRAFVALGDADVREDEWRELVFGDESERPFTDAQIRFLTLRGAYFPWKVCVHLLENDTWDDKHSGAGKDFTDEARALFPHTIAMIRALPFTEIGRALIFGLHANDHAPAHRDSEPGAALSIAQSISIDPRGTKRFYVSAREDEPVVVAKRVYWFNDMDWHGVLPDPFFRYSIRIDGVFARPL